MNIPDAVVEAAAEAIFRHRGYTGWKRADDFDRQAHERQARAAIEAAMPAIREAIAQEIEAMPHFDGTGYIIEKYDAARIVRGGTP